MIKFTGAYSLETVYHDFDRKVKSKQCDSGRDLLIQYYKKIEDYKKIEE